MIQIFFVLTALLAFSSQGEGHGHMSPEEREAKHQERMIAFEKCVEQEGNGISVEDAKKQMKMTNEVPADLACLTKCLMVNEKKMDESGLIKPCNKHQKLPETVANEFNKCVENVNGEEVTACEKALKFRNVCMKILMDEYKKSKEAKDQA